MERTHWGQHEESCFGCKLHTINIDPYAMPSRLHPNKPARTPSNSWEKGVPTDSRGMPFLKADGTPMGQKEYSEKRSLIDANRRRLHNEPAKPTGST